MDFNRHNNVREKIKYQKVTNVISLYRLHEHFYALERIIST